MLVRFLDLTVLDVRPVEESHQDHGEEQNRYAPGQWFHPAPTAAMAARSLYIRSFEHAFLHIAVYV